MNHSLKTLILNAALTLSTIIVILFVFGCFAAGKESERMHKKLDTIIDNQMEIIENISSINQDTFHSNE